MDVIRAVALSTGLAAVPSAPVHAPPRVGIVRELEVVVAIGPAMVAAAQPVIGPYVDHGSYPDAPWQGGRFR